ncbi:hypothetical protein ABW20_dc0109294 [Dactylellina cionopaga]|nr:hypothetical protein ABW20_dc0109294 [Dactylellina cionopaga]
MTVQAGNPPGLSMAQPKATRQTLSDCFEVACQRFNSEIADPLIKKDSKRAPAIEQFLKGIQLRELERCCKDLSNKAEEKANNNASKLLTTLDQLKGVGDALLQFAPESISIVWFGISSLISIGNARVQTRLLICGTCDSIASIISDCVRWEARMVQSAEEAPKLDIWDSDVPDLIFGILDFLWNARPHLDEGRVKRFGNSLKDFFTKELQQKVDYLLEKYGEIVKLAQAHFEESVIHESLKVLDPTFGGGQPSNSRSGANTSDFLTNMVSLSEAIRKVAEAIPNRVYLVVDALDECQDRQDQNLTQHLKNIVKSKTDMLRVIMSARDSIDVVGELMEVNDKGDRAKATKPHLPGNIQVIEITAEKNSSDLEDYLKHDVGNLLRRRIDESQFSDFFNLELSRIVDIIHQKAKGDFTLARMIIANLQQPSKESLERKVQNLPAAIGQIYMSSIESLSPDEQELVVTALKWVVWSVSAIDVMVISDHYRELYKYKSEELPQGAIAMHQRLYASEMAKLVEKNQYEDPEIKDIIYHIENAGRDFFRFDKNTGIVGVDISIREWVQEDTKGSKLKSKSMNREARGFNKYCDDEGNTVFKFTLTQTGGTSTAWVIYQTICSLKLKVVNGTRLNIGKTTFEFYRRGGMMEALMIAGGQIYSRNYPFSRDQKTGIAGGTNPELLNYRTTRDHRDNSSLSITSFAGIVSNSTRYLEDIWEYWGTMK